MNPLMMSAGLLAGALCLGMNAAEAAVVDLDYQELDMKTTKQKGTLVFSDSPEYVEGPGVLAEGTIQGKGRIYYYHVNDAGYPLRLVAYARSDGKAKVTVTKFIQGEPSMDYVTSGRKLSFEEMVSIGQTPVVTELTPGKRTVIAQESPEGMVPDYLYTGLVEVKTDAPVHFGIAALPAVDDSELQKALDEAQPVSADSHEMRGTFPMEVYQENKKPWNVEKDGPVQIDFGSSSGHDYLSGMDELDQVMRENTGSYGITMHFKVNTEGKGKYRLYFNAMGGVYLGAFKVTQAFLPYYYRTDDLKFGGRWFGYDDYQACMDAGVWEAGRPVTIEIMPAGASYLPVRFLFVPEAV